MSIQGINQFSAIPSYNKAEPAAAPKNESGGAAAAGDSVALSSGKQADYVPGELIVKFKGGAFGSMEDGVKSPVGGMGTVIKKFDIPASGRSGEAVVHMKLNDNLSVEQALEQLKTNSNVAYAEPNYIITVPQGENNESEPVAGDGSVDSGSAAAQKKPNDLDPKLWGLHNTGQTGGKANADIDAPEAWNITTGKKNTKGGPLVAVIDTGIDLKHPDLVKNLWVNKGEIAGDGKDNDKNGYIDDVHGYDFVGKKGSPIDDHSHGTHCAGTIAAQGNNALGITGVAWDASIMALRTLGKSGGTTAAAIEAVTYATKMGADIISASWGGGGYSTALNDAISAFPGLFIAAAGNSAVDNDASPHYPSSYNSPNVIAVASTDHNDKLSSFSNYGKKSVHIAAPGSSIYSTVPDGKYASKSGTSMATPHVSGVAALVMSKFPQLSAAEVKQAILSSGDTLDSLKDKVSTGKRLNAHQALLAAQQIADAKKAGQAEV